MTYVVGNATHFRGRALLGDPQPGDVYRYNGSAFACDLGLNQCEQEIVRNRRNIQLLFLQQAAYHHIVFGDAVNGFYDSFEDDSGVDPAQLIGQYAALSGCYESVPDLEPEGVHSLAAGMLERRDCRRMAAVWYQDAGAAGHFEGAEAGFDVGANTTSEGGGAQTGFPAAGHGLTAGDVVRFSGFGTGSFNGVHTVQSGTTTAKIVIDVAYAFETIGGGCARRKVLRLGTGGDCPDVAAGMVIRVDGFEDAAIVSIDEGTSGAAAGGVVLSAPMSSGNLAGIHDAAVFNGRLHPVYRCEDACAITKPSTPGTRPHSMQLNCEIVHCPTRKYYTIGGYDYVTGQYERSCCEYDIDADAWQEVTLSGDLVPYSRHHVVGNVTPLGKYLVMGIDLLQNGTPASTTPWMAWFDPAAATWTTITPANYPTIYTRSTGAYDSVGHCFWVFGGDTSAGGGSGVSNELWCYDIDSNTWTQKGLTAPMSARARMSMIYEPSHGLLMYGGVDGSSAFLSDLWRYDIASDAWTQLTPSGTAPGVANVKHCYEPQNGRWYIWGGMDSPSTYNPYVYYYDASANAWGQLYYSGPLIYGSHTSRSAISILDGKMYCFGGTLPSGYDNDVRIVRVHDPVPAATCVAAAANESSCIEVTGCGSVSAASLCQFVPPDSSVLYAISADSGEAWSVLSDGAVRDVARMEGGVWQVHSGDAWVAAAVNDGLWALREAALLLENQMSGAELLSANSAAWESWAAANMPCDAVYVAVVLTPGAAGVPAVAGWTFNRIGGLDVQTVPVPALAATSRVSASFLVKAPQEEGFRCYLAADESNPQWVELPGMNKVADMAGSVEFWASETADVSGGGAGIAIRVRANHPSELHGWAASWNG